MRCVADRSEQSAVVQHTADVLRSRIRAIHRVVLHICCRRPMLHPVARLFVIGVAKCNCLVRVRFSGAAVQPHALKAKTERRGVALRPMLYRTQRIRDRSCGDGLFCLSTSVCCRQQHLTLCKWCPGRVSKYCVLTGEGARTPAAYHMPHLERLRGQDFFSFQRRSFLRTVLWRGDQDSLAMMLPYRAGRSAGSSQLLVENIFQQRARAHVTPLHATGQWNRSVLLRTGRGDI